MTKYSKKYIEDMTTYIIQNINKQLNRYKNTTK